MVLAVLTVIATTMTTVTVPAGTRMAKVVPPVVPLKQTLAVTLTMMIFEYSLLTLARGVWPSRGEAQDGWFWWILICIPIKVITGWGGLMSLNAMVLR